MNQEQQRLKYLFGRLTSDRLEQAEYIEFMRLINDQDNEEFVKSLISENIDNEAVFQPDPVRSNKVLTTIISEKKRAAVIRNLKRWTAAAAIIAIAIISWYILNINRQLAPVTEVSSSFKNDIEAPASSRALLKLSNGKYIYLDDASAGILATEGSTSIKKDANGNIIYNGDPAGKLTYNTLELPRGAKPISINLSDNSRVWINAGSSITFPVAFGKKERMVNIEGEIYFEIKKDASRPFIVKGRNNTRVEVLGTNFNINSYADEPSVNITLVEGAVRVTNQSSQQLLSPGEQAIVTNNISINNKIDISEVMAWKNGVFQFESTGIDAIMRQLSRAYNISYEIQGKVNETFGGSISRSVNLSQVLTMLELTKVVSFEVEGTKIIVRPG